MVSSRKMRGLIGFDDAVSSCRWQVAERYWLYGDEVRADPEAGWKRTMDRPLADHNLFLSFAKLGGRGQKLPDTMILRWIRKHGLLRLRDTQVDRLSLDNQAPVAVDDFREEARRAHEALTLFTALHSKNWVALRPRISRRRIDPPGKPGEGTSADVCLDGQRIPMVYEASGALTDEVVRVAARNGLEWFVKARLRAISLDFDHYLGHPRPQEVYRPRLVVSIPDLYSAVWYQMACLMADTRPVKYCELCERPIFHPRRDQEVCDATCRQAKRRKKKALEDSV